METFELNQTLLKQRCLTCNQEFLPSDNLKSCLVDGTMLSPVFDDPFVHATIDGKYEVIERIAIGAKAKIYKARHLHLDKFVALKVLQVGTSLTQAQVARFQKEAQVALGLVHPNIVRVYDYGTLPQPYIVMEYVDGKTLSALIKDSEFLPPQRALPLFLDIANAMCAAHAAGLVHRDLKPSNVIVDSTSSQAKVLDFGLVKDFIDDAHYTKTGDIVGSPSYMSPEQWKGESLDGRADVYSFGCLMYEVLTGVSPFAASNPVECMYKHLEVKPPKLSKVRRGLKFPPGANVLIGNCLVKDKNKRYRSMVDVRQDLLAIQAGKGRRVKHINRFRTIRLVIGGWVALQVLLLSLGLLALAYGQWSRPQWEKDLRKGIDLQMKRNPWESMPLLIAAEREAKKARAPHWSFEEIYTYLGQGYLNTGHPEKSIDCLAEALEINKLHAEDVPRSFCHEKLSDAYIQIGDYEKALEHGKTAVDIANRQSNNNWRKCFCHESLARALRGLKRYDEAIAELNIAREFAVKREFDSNQGHFTPLYHQIMNFVSDHLPTTAATEGNSRLVNIYWHLGDCYRHLNRTSDSFGAYSEALRLASELEPDTVPAIAGEFLPLLKKDREALKFIDETALRQHWQPFLTALLRGLVLRQQGKPAQALPELDAALENAPDAPGLRAWTLNWRASTLEKQKKSAEALNDLDAALKLLQERPQYANWKSVLACIYTQKGYCQLRKGMFAEAEDSCRKAIAIDKGYSSAHRCLADCLDRLNRHDEATKERTEATHGISND